MLQFYIEVKSIA